MTFISMLKRELKRNFHPTPMLFAESVKAISWTAGNAPTRVHFISFTASSPLRFVVHPYSYTRIIQQRAERNRIVTAHKFSFLTFAKVFLDRWDVYGFGQKDIFGESSSCLLVLCDNVCERKTVFWKIYRTWSLSVYPCCCCLRLEHLHVSTWSSTCGFIFLVMKHSEWILQ
jgi:hypothetical protein